MIRSILYDFMWAPLGFLRCLYKKLTPLFSKSGLEFHIEQIDTDACVQITWVTGWLSDFKYGIQVRKCPSYEFKFQHIKVRNWSKMMPTSATLKNAYLSRKTDEENNMKVPQSFSFMCREGRGFLPKKTTGYCTPHSKSILCPCQTYLDKGITFRWMRMYHGAYGWVVPWKMYLLWSRASCLTKSWFNHHPVFTLSPFEAAQNITSTEWTAHKTSLYSTWNLTEFQSWKLWQLCFLKTFHHLIVAYDTIVVW